MTSGLEIEKMIAKAYKLSSEGKLSEALEVYSELIKGREISELYNQRGIVYMELENFDKSIADFSKAILLKDDDPDLFCNRGNAYFKNDSYENALRDFNEAIKLYGTEPKAFNGRGSTYLKIGNYEAAQIDFMRAIELDGNYNSPYFNLGLVYYFINNFDAALACLKKANQLSPNDTNIIMALGMVYDEGLLNPNEAKEHFLKVLNINSNNIKALESLAWLESTCKDPQFRNGREALSYAKKGCELTFWKNARCLEALAAAHAECGEFELAIQMENEAKKFANSEELIFIEKCLKILEKKKPIRI